MPLKRQNQDQKPSILNLILSSNMDPLSWNLKFRPQVTTITTPPPSLKRRRPWSPLTPWAARPRYTTFSFLHPTTFSTLRSSTHFLNPSWGLLLHLFYYNATTSTTLITTLRTPQGKISVPSPTTTRPIKAMKRLMPQSARKHKGRARAHGGPAGHAQKKQNRPKLFETIFCRSRGDLSRTGRGR